MNRYRASFFVVLLVGTACSNNSPTSLPSNPSDNPSDILNCPNGTISIDETCLKLCTTNANCQTVTTGEVCRPYMGNERKVCQPQGMEDALCDEDDDCMPTFVCSEGQCAVATEDTPSPSCLSNVDCAQEGKVCRKSTAQSSSASCQYRGTLGQPCDLADQNADCAESLVCDRETCRYGLYHTCTKDDECANNCPGVTSCAERWACVHRASDETLHCAERAENGDFCKLDNDCKSNLCLSDQCVLAEACEDNADCELELKVCRLNWEGERVCLSFGEYGDICDDADIGADSDCEPGLSCSHGLCKLDSGSPCSDALDECAVASCLGGFCCAGACSGNCATCDDSGACVGKSICTGCDSCTESGNTWNCTNSCQADASCVSGACKLNDGVSCGDNHNACGSDLCLDNCCKPFVTTSGCCACSGTGDCSAPCGAGGSCVNSICKYGFGDPCIGDGDCLSGYCDGTCKLGDGAFCGEPTDCGSGLCMGQHCCSTPCKFGTCGCDTNGNCVRCNLNQACNPDFICKFIAGERCKVDAQCLSGVCQNGFCTVGGVGHPCGDDTDCGGVRNSCMGNCCDMRQPPLKNACYCSSGDGMFTKCLSNEICGEDFICKLKPGLSCTSSDLCYMGACVGNVCKLDDGAPCAASSECQSNNCVDDVCVAVSGPCPGIPCQAGYDCFSGICKLALGQPCDRDSACGSNHCKGNCCDWRTTGVPMAMRCTDLTCGCAAANSPAGAGTCLNCSLTNEFCQDYVCRSKLGIGERCTSYTDCSLGLLCKGTCSSGGAFCMEGVPCLTGVCNSFCSAKLAVGASCTEDIECSSNHCYHGTCKLGVGEPCATASQCLSNICYGKVTTTCRNAPGEYCSGDDECGSGGCGGFYCCTNKCPSTGPIIVCGCVQGTGDCKLCAYREVCDTTTYTCN